MCCATAETALPLLSAQDHKRVGEGDTGPNTGGMGAYAPTAIMTEAIIATAMQRIIEPTLKTMAARGHPYRGVLYAGLMLTAQGPKLVEYNCRFGDPECQVLMTMMAGDIVPLLHACAVGALAGHQAQWHDGTAITVVMAADGYPGAYEKNTQIKGLDALGDAEQVTVFHAGTQIAPDGTLRAIGGRVLNVTARGKTVEQARANAYAAIDAIDWPQGFCRRDIGWRELTRGD